MGLFAVLPPVAALGFVFAMARIGMRAGSPPGPKAWMVPAVLCALFLGWTLFAVASEGPIGFWANHISNAWGNQIWFDLLLAGGSAAFAIAPAARRAGMRVELWLLLIVLTGSIGILAMLSRCLYLRQRSA